MPSVGKLNLKWKFIVLLHWTVIVDTLLRSDARRPPLIPPNQSDAFRKTSSETPIASSVSYCFVYINILFTCNRMFLKPFSGLKSNNNILQSDCAIRNTWCQLRSNQRRHSYRFSPSACLTFIMTFLLWLYRDYATRSMPRKNSR